MTKTWGRPITDKELNLIVRYVAGRGTLVQLMHDTGTNTMSVYSLIVRGSRIAYQRGLLKGL